MTRKEIFQLSHLLAKFNDYANEQCNETLPHVSQGDQESEDHFELMSTFRNLSKLLSDTLRTWMGESIAKDEIGTVLDLSGDPSLKAAINIEAYLLEEWKACLEHVQASHEREEEE